MRGTLVVCPNLESASREAAERLVTATTARAKARSPFRLALAGGSTPRQLYTLLAGAEFRNRIPWPQMHFFWGDERLVPHDHPQSNFRMAVESLLKHVPVPSQNMHPVPTQGSPDTSALAYEQLLRTHFNQRRSIPTFDLILLGLGTDGHTASLFPNTPALDEKERLVVAHNSPAVQPARVTFTFPLLNKAQRVFFLVAGEDKATTLHNVLEGRGQLPACRVQPKKGELVWFVDLAAAGQLPQVRVES